MSEQPPEASEKEAPAEALPSAAEGSGLARTERLFLRLTFWQTLLSVAGVFIGVVALYAALSESEAVRQQTAAAVWPFVQLVVEDSDTGEKAEFTLSFTNAGVGPARMRTMRVTVDGRAIGDWTEALATPDVAAEGKLSRNFISNRVLSPDERVEAVSVKDPALAREFQALLRNPGNYISFCYCSIFDDCWLADSRKTLQDPEPVGQCPDYGAAAFGS